MYEYTPILKSILTSTIWSEPPYVRVVWLAMLLSADRKGRLGASVPGIARISAVSIDEARDAISRLEAPDTDSRSKEYSGRRIEAIDGGWQILNYAKHRELINKSGALSAERVKRCRERKRNVVTLHATLCNDQDQEGNQNQSGKIIPPLPPLGESRNDRHPEPEACLQQPQAPIRASFETLPATLGPPDPKPPSEGKPVALAAKHQKTPKASSVKQPPPSDFQADEATLAVATETGRDWRADWTACRDWHLAAGPAKYKVDYQATLRGWMRRGLDTGSPRLPFSKPEKWGPGGGNGPQPNNPDNPYDPYAKPKLRDTPWQPRRDV